ncbi:MAG: 3-isopropylmalate dehydrogenase [Anaerohalosphaeraceae bacterium]|nr:3-isopropylmalate dehydrogenase [Anaerohalosphaeraceae bacterium]
MKTYDIAVMGGDGTGPEVTVEAIKVMKAAEAKFGFKTNLTDFDFGGERYKKTGETLPDSAVEEFRKFDAILLGAIGHPDVAPGILEKGILLKARFELDQYINLRPVKLFPGVECPLKGKGPADIDYVVVRENTGDAYTGTGGFTLKGTPHEVAVQSSVYNRFQVDRCLKYAFDYAQKKGKKARGIGKENTLALCGKTNVLTYIYDLWERGFNEMGEKDYADIRRDYYHVDATCMWMVKNPEWFDVIVTGNMFGDIITDLAAMTQGGMGIAAGGNINPDPGGVSMFEPIGGSAPKYTGQGVINPLAAICSMQMMLETLGEDEAAAKIEEAVKWATGEKMESMQAGRMGYDTSGVGDLIATKVAD